MWRFMAWLLPDAHYIEVFIKPTTTTTTAAIRKFLTPCKVPEQLLLDGKNPLAWKPALKELRTHGHQFPPGGRPRAARVGRRLLLREGVPTPPITRTVPRIA